ncbi:MAG: DegV family protein [Dorea sp.]|nr:DegV family protein [Dorea sp.]
MVRFIADSGIDIAEMEGVDFRRVPLTISTEDDMHWLDDESLDIHEMIETLINHKGRSFTACPSIEAWMNAFGADVDEVPDEIYVLTLTSGLSGTYNSAVLAKNMLLENYPDTKVHVVDSRSVGPEMVLVMNKMVELKKAGCTFEEVVEKIADYQKHVRIVFAFQSIHNLVQNGRVNKLAAAAAGVLGICFEGTATEEGTIRQTAKCRGEKKIIAQFKKDLKEYGYAGGKVRLHHTENEQLAIRVADAIKADYPDAEIDYVETAGLCSYYVERGGIVCGFETECEQSGY